MKKRALSSKQVPIAEHIWSNPVRYTKNVGEWKQWTTSTKGNGNEVVKAVYQGGLYSNVLERKIVEVKDKGADSWGELNWNFLDATSRLSLKFSKPASPDASEHRE